MLEPVISSPPRLIPYDIDSVAGKRYNRLFEECPRNPVRKRIRTAFDCLFSAVKERPVKLCVPQKHSAVLTRTKLQI
jgi:hypothetical protein